MNRLMQTATCVLVACIALSVFGVNVTLKNHTEDALWVYINRLNPDRTDHHVTDYEAILLPQGTLKESGTFSELWVFPVRTSLSLSDLERDLSLPEFKREIRDRWSVDDASGKLRELAFNAGLYQEIGEGDWVMSYDEEPISKRKYLYFGQFKTSEPFALLFAPEVRTLAKTEADLQKMDMKKYGGEEKRARELEKFRTSIAIRDRIISYINDKNRRVQAVILQGEAGSDPEVFNAVWHRPINAALQAVTGGANIGKLSPYLSTWHVGPIRFINLGLKPTWSFKQAENLETEISSLRFLEDELQRSIGHPVIIYFNYPTHGPGADAWSKAEKDAFHRVINEHNVIAILHGNAPESAVYNVSGKWPVIRLGGNDFAELRFDPRRSNEITFTFIDAQGNTRIIK